jgi:hypothetical protein
MKKQQMENLPWYHTTPFNVILHSGWIMAFQRTECSWGPAPKSETDLKLVRCTSITRKLVINHMRINLSTFTGLLPVFTWDKVLMKNNTEVNWSSLFHLKTYEQSLNFTSRFFPGYVHHGFRVGHDSFQIRWLNPERRRDLMWVSHAGIKFT